MELAYALLIGRELNVLDDLESLNVHYAFRFMRLSQPSRRRDGVSDGVLSWPEEAKS